MVLRPSVDTATAGTLVTLQPETLGQGTHLLGKLLGLRNLF